MAAIEPLSSAMTYQAQNTQQARPVQKTAENMDVSKAVDQVATFDPTTAKIKEVDGKDKDGADTGSQSFAGQQQASNEQIKKAVEQLNKNMSHSEAIFGIHEETNRVTIKIVDKDTKEVIKELPPEKTLDMIAKAWELAGILVDEKR